MKYTKEILIEELIYDWNDESNSVNKDYDFDDCVVSVKGEIFIDYYYYRGNYWEEPYQELAYRSSDLKVIKSNNDETEEDITDEIERGLRFPLD